MKPRELQLGPPLVFYNGAITLRFDEPSWTYYLVRDDGSLEAQSGVTGITKIIDKPYLKPWAAKMMFLKLLRTMPRDGENIKAIPWVEFSQIAEEAKSAHTERLEEAGDVGTAAHTWIENSIRNAIANTRSIVEKMNDFAPTDERSVNCGLAAFDWMQKHNVRWISTEHKIYSRQYKYAGTSDGTATVDSCDDPTCCPRMFLDELSLIDWKSSNQLSLEYLMQTAAYQNALMEETGAEIKSRWILRLGKEDGKFESWHEYNFEDDFKGYLACLSLSLIYKAIEKRMSTEKKLKTFRKREEKQTEKKKIAFAKRKA